jgi:hypothetical protein
MNNDKEKNITVFSPNFTLNEIEKDFMPRLEKISDPWTFKTIKFLHNECGERFNININISYKNKDNKKLKP